MVSGSAVGEHSGVLMTNATPIDLRRGTGNTWTVSAFTLRYVDGAAQTWDVNVSAGTWELAP